jgi:capsular polysaccharide biosynthesis protein
MAVLQERGFESHVLEDYSFGRQMKLFMEADVIAGPHGAGLANMLFAENPLVVELFPETVLKPQFYFLASILGFEYEAIVTDGIKNNLRIDIAHLQQRLDEIGL